MNFLNGFGRKIINSFSYTIGSNLLSLGISLIVVLMIPKIIGIQEYGYWQLYLFYTTFVGLLHFGWLDGIFLKHGGEEYDKLDKNNLYSQFILFIIFQLIISLVLFFATFTLNFTENKKTVLQYISCFIFVNNIRFLLMYILQVTSRIKEYAMMIILDRIMYFLLLISLIVIGITSFKILIIVDLVGKLLSLLLGIYYCREIVLRFQPININVLKEIINNISIGIKLMLSNITNSLIIGVSRFGIENNWTILSFAKVSLALNLSSMVFIFINALSVVIYPLLRKIKEENIAKFYKSITTVLNVTLILLLFAFYPLKFILVVWLPAYADSVIYLSVIFPMIISEGKILLIINNLYAALRLEKELLFVNLGTLALSTTITFASIINFNSILLIVTGIPFVLLIRYHVLDYWLKKKIKASKEKYFPVDIIFVTTFIVIQQLMNDFASAIILLLFYLLYLKLNRVEIKESINYFKKVLL